MYLPTNRVPFLSHLSRHRISILNMDGKEPIALELTDRHMKIYVAENGDMILRVGMSLEEMKETKKVLVPESYNRYCLDKLKDQIKAGRAFVFGMSIARGRDNKMQRASKRWKIIELPS